MSLMDLLLAAPSAQDRFQEVSGLMGQGQGLAGLGAPTAGGMGPTGGTSDWEQRARQYFMGHEGYSKPEWNALDSIIERESGWDPTAVNPNGGAYGIPQILPSAHPNANLENDPMGQIQWLANYISERYGSPLDALAFKDREGWY